MNSEPRPGFGAFVRLWSSQSISVIGSALTFFAVNIWLTQVRFPALAQKPLLAVALAASTLSFMLPTVLVAPVAGAWADRHDRRSTMFRMNLAAFVLSAVMVTLLVAGTLQPWMLYSFLAAYGALGAFHTASFESSYALLVEPAQLPRATGMMQGTMALSNVLSPALAAVLIGLPALARQGHATGVLAPIAALSNGTALAVAVDAATFLLAAIALIGLRLKSLPRANSPHRGARALAHDIAEGARFVWHRRPMLWLIGTFATVNFILGPVTVMQPLIVKFNLAADWKARHLTFESSLALLATSAGVGGIIGALAIGMWGGLKRRRVRGVLWPMVLGGAAVALYGLSSTLALAVVALAFMGFMLPATNAHSQAIWMEITPLEMQGRVLSTRRFIGQITFPLGSATAGWLGARFDPGVATAVLGALMALFALIQLMNPMLTRIEDHEWLEAFARKSSSVSAPRT